MQSHFNLNDQQFETAFEKCTLDPVLFSHEAHLRLAWIHIDKYGEEHAIRNICRQLKNYVRFVGAEDKFNLTVTIAAIKAVNHFMKRWSGESFKDFISRWPRLKTNFKDLMSAHYTENIFVLPDAKLVFLEPDLLPFE